MKNALALLGAAVGAGAFDHYQPTGVDGWTTCVMKDGSESCPISNMQRDQSSVVEPGGESSRSPAYASPVWEGVMVRLMAVAIRTRGAARSCGSCCL